MALIGTSLSLCVKDILDGHVQESDVDKIISRTCAPKPRIEELLNDYLTIYWKNNPEGKAIAQRLFDAGKVEQPRLDNKPYPMGIGNNWVASEDEIRWSNEDTDFV